MLPLPVTVKHRVVMIPDQTEEGIDGYGWKDFEKRKVLSSVLVICTPGRNNHTRHLVAYSLNFSTFNLLRKFVACHIVLCDLQDLQRVTIGFVCFTNSTLLCGRFI